MTSLSIGEVVERYPDFRVAVLRAADLAVAASRSPALTLMIDEAQATCRARWGADELSSIPAVAVWRGAYRGFGVKKTSYRSSVERLFKRVLSGGDLPQVNNLVDLYNCMSLNYGLCLGADDLEKTNGDLAFRFSRPGDTFFDMSVEAGEDPNDPPKNGEVVYADQSHILCRRWNWRQDGRSLVTPETRNAVLTIQSNRFGKVEAAAAELARTVAIECGGRCHIAIADRTAPVVEF
jgi:DNA/RNA-binding domain of Phe-tRNA-synthetase-like protein